jgi:hypothetical protein
MNTPTPATFAAEHKAHGSRLWLLRCLRPTERDAWAALLDDPGLRGHDLRVRALGRKAPAVKENHR